MTLSSSRWCLKCVCVFTCEISSIVNRSSSKLFNSTVFLHNSSHSWCSLLENHFYCTVWCEACSAEIWFHTEPRESVLWLISCRLTKNDDCAFNQVVNNCKMEGTRITCLAAMYQETVVSGDRERQVNSSHKQPPDTEVRGQTMSEMCWDSQSTQILVVLRHVIDAALLFQTLLLDFDTSQMTNR